MKRISDTINFPRTYRPNLFQKAWNFLKGYIYNVFQPLLTITDFFASKLLGMNLYKKPKEDEYSNAKRRYNHVVALKLRQKTLNKTFWVATYHMPCVFYDPPVMVMHLTGLLKFLENMRKDEHRRTPLILTGDFNIKPRDSTYPLLTGGTIDR